MFNNDYAGVLCFGALGQMLLTCFGRMRPIDDCNSSVSGYMLPVKNKTVVHEFGFHNNSFCAEQVHGSDGEISVPCLRYVSFNQVS